MRSRFPTTFWLLLAASALVLFFRLGSYGLVETSDARYAEIASEMYLSGDWLTPHLNYIKHFHKPPLTYWVTAAGYHLLGYNEWGARLSLGLAALGTLLLTYALARRLYGERAGQLAWLILLSMGGFLGAHRLLTTDPLLTLALTAALYSFWRWQEGEGAGWSHAFFACLGAAMMTKGPVGILVVWLIILAWALAAGRLARLSRLRWGTGLAIFCLLGLPWYLYMVWRNEGLLHYFLFGQLADRVSGEMGHRYPFWYSPLTFLLYALPWTPFLLLALWRALAGRRREGEARGAAYLAAWCLVPVAFFALPATKLPNYILPALPAAAVLLAAWWRDAPLAAGGRAAAALLAAALLAYPALLWVRPHLTPGLEGLALQVAVVGGAAALLCGATALSARPWPAIAGAATLLPALIIAAGLQVEALPLRSYRPLGEQAAAALSPGTRLCSYKCNLFSLPYYTRQRVVEAGMGRETQFERQDTAAVLPSPEALLEGWESGGRTLCVLPEWALRDFDGRRYRLLGKHRKLVLISNDTPTGGPRGGQEVSVPDRAVLGRRAGQASAADGKHALGQAQGGQRP